MMKLLLLLLLGIGAEARPATDAEEKMMAAIRRKLSSPVRHAAAVKDKIVDVRRRLQTSAVCNDPDDLSTLLFGEDLKGCLCEHDLFDEGTDEDDICDKCKDEVADWCDDLTDGEDIDGVDCECDSGGSSNPCFARETTTACRVHDIAAPPADAYAQCFLDESGAAAERVLMTSLSAGDYVLTQAADGALAHTRVILNQHKVARDSDASSPLLTLYHERGTLGLSPDHVLRVGGEFGPARTATAGADLAAADGKSARVSRVEVSRGGVVNPLTVAGTILAAGPTGAPVLASVYGEWIADYFLGVVTYPLPYSLGSALAYLFPEHVQAYYDTVLEPPFLAGAAHLKSISAAAPDAVIGAIVFGFDLALGAGFAAYALAAHAKVAVALAAVGAAAVYKKRKSA